MGTRCAHPVQIKARVRFAAAFAQFVFGALVEAARRRSGRLGEGEFW